jgi:hypothetical protein
MATAQPTSKLSGAMRKTFGVVIFVAWGLMTILWVYDAIYAIITRANPAPAIAAVGAILLMLLLAGMEGLEVAVIDRWRDMFPDRPRSELGAWLSSRQLFVALIVTAATLLAERDSIAVPILGTEITGHVALKVFNLVWTTLTVLWFMQILPKLLAAANPDGYLHHMSGPLFPIVEFVRKIGIGQPGEWTSLAVQKRLGWYGEPGIEEAPVRRADTPASAWATLIPERAPRRPQSSDEQAAGPTGS